MTKPDSYQQIAHDLHNLVKNACKKKTNIFGYGAWTHHILSVVKYARILGKKLNANLKILEIAAILHDYASVLDKKFYPKHHLYGASLAEEVLKKYPLPEAEIKRIKQAIFCHRASKKNPPKTIEDKVLASADSLAHFDNVDSLLYLAYVQHKMGIDEGTKWVLEKLERSYQKLIPEAKNLIKEKYQAIKETLA